MNARVKVGGKKIDVFCNARNVSEITEDTEFFCYNDNTESYKFSEIVLENWKQEEAVSKQLELQEAGIKAMQEAKEGNSDQFALVAASILMTSGHSLTEAVRIVRELIAEI